jgi:2-hydroxychromene-2-carboxylate isomerase
MALRACGREWITVHTLPFFSTLTVMATSSIDWYFDFVSPYSYLCFHRLAGISSVMTYKPVLFAGLLEHWGQKGPAEIPVKRRWTYRWCTWWAQELGIPFRFPAAHPFNPLQHLRLALAAGCTPDAVHKIFDVIWTGGGDASDREIFSQLCSELNIEPAALSSPQIKDALRKNTAEAAARGVFGVPSFVVDGELFWGADSIEFLKDFLVDPAVVRNEEMRRLDALPVAAARKI